MRLRLAAYLSVLAAIAAACGGRVLESDGEMAAGGNSTRGGAHSSGSSGSFGHAGASSSSGAGGTFGFGGMPHGLGGATASGGAIGSAGTAASGGVCGCAPVACPLGAGFVTVPNPDGCCYHCECNTALCPGIACGSGSHIETGPGQCCPTCVQDDCRTEQAAYQSFKKQLVDKYAQGCMTSDDCAVYYDKNQCGAGCGAVVTSSAVNNLDSNLQSYARQTCSPNCPVAVPPCPAPAMPFCFNGRCL